MGQLMTTICPKCQCEFQLPVELEAAARKNEAISVFCPHGHQLHFPAGESEVQKLRRERDHLAGRVTNLNERNSVLQERIGRLYRRLAATQGVVTRMRRSPRWAS
jgi:hypothetical protein